MMSKPKNRWQAFAIHLSISAIIFIVLAALIYFVWYPGFLFYADGGIQGMQLIAGVDLVLGPLLTLIVYNAAKKTLKTDLMIIACIQFVCLAIGTALVYIERPIAVIYADGTFYSMSKGAFEVTETDLDSALSLPHRKLPVWIYVDLPIEAQARSEMRKNAINEGLLHLRSDKYLPYQPNLKHIKALGQPIDELEHDLKNAKTLPTTARLYKVSTRYSSGSLAIDSENGQPLQYFHRNKTI